MFEFKIENKDGYARAGTLKTPHGDIKTPVFMPVGTQATIKGLSKEDIKTTQSQIMLSNTYHLEVKPGSELIEEFGGLHEFMNIDLPILTDSGGFQVFSLGLGGGDNSENLAKITEEGVSFKSHRDGSKHFFSPEKAMQIQERLGADILMAFDECCPGESRYGYAKAAMRRTHRWAVRCVIEHNKLQENRIKEGKNPQALFPILQGVIYEDLRIESAKFIGSLDCPGIAIGGLSVGETTKDMYRILDAIKDHLPEEKPHYLMGVGRPENLVEGINRGIDMFDCVLATRLGRHGVAFSNYGDLRVLAEKFKHDKSGIPTKPGYETYVSKNYTMGYIRHLLTVQESLGHSLLSRHNIEFLNIVMSKSREAILEGKYKEFMKDFFEGYVVKEKK